MESDNDVLLIVWLMMCTFLVLLMQAGFTCFESGHVRTKNSINVALKNVADFCISAACFWAFGYAIMYGVSYGGFFGTTGFLYNETDNGVEMSFMLFQLMFCSTSATIIAGAIAERTRFSSYMIITLITAGFLFPIMGHWAWAGRGFGAQEGQTLGWLAQIGFIDFAGSTVVHSLGGWMALAAMIVVGPRKGRFTKSGGVIQIFGYNLPLSALGTFLLFFGWFGFNGGSLLAIDGRLPLVILNTTIAGAFGGLSVLLICSGQRSLSGIRFVLNAVLAGLVAITASSNMMSPLDASIIGAIGGLLSYWVTNFLERLKLDDAVGAVPVHLAAGIWGTLAVAIFGDTAQFTHPYSRLEQLGVQSLGVIVCMTLVFGVGFSLLKIINYFYPLRVSSRVELMGLNYGEHGVRGELFDLVESMKGHSRNKDFSHPVEVNDYSETALISTEYNSLLQEIDKEFTAFKENESKLTELAKIDALTGIANRLEFDETFEREWSLSRSGGYSLSLIIVDVDNFKNYNDRYGHILGDKCLILIAECLRKSLKRHRDLVARVGGEEFAILLPDTDYESVAHIARTIRDDIQDLAIPHGASSAASVVTISLGVASVASDANATKGNLYEAADKALYRAKDDGRNRWRKVQV